MLTQSDWQNSCTILVQEFYFILFYFMGEPLYCEWLSRALIGGAVVYVGVQYSVIKFSTEVQTVTGKSMSPTVVVVVISQYSASRYALSVCEHISVTAVILCTYCVSSVAVARFSFGGVALRNVLRVLWMTSRLAVMGGTPKGGGCTQRRRSMTWRYWGAVWCVYEC